MNTGTLVPGTDPEGHHRPEGPSGQEVTQYPEVPGGMDNRAGEGLRRHRCVRMRRTCAGQSIWTINGSKDNFSVVGSRFFHKMTTPGQVRCGAMRKWLRDGWLIPTTNRPVTQAVPARNRTNTRLAWAGMTLRKRDDRSVKKMKVVPSESTNV